MQEEQVVVTAEQAEVCKRIVDRIVEQIEMNDVCKQVEQSDVCKQVDAVEQAEPEQPVDQPVAKPVINILEPEFCVLNVLYTADQEIVAAKRDEAVANFRKLKIPGFRQGKANDQVIKLKFRKQIDAYLQDEMAQIAFDDIVFETNVKPIGSPKVVTQNLNGNSYTCEMTIYKKPSFELTQYKNFEIPEPHLDITVGKLSEQTLLNLRFKFASMTPFATDDLIEMGDQVNVSTKSVSGHEVNIESETYQVGSKAKPWPEFDDALLGMMTGETREFDVKWADNTTGRLAVTFHIGTKVKPHAIDDEFYGLVNVKDIEDLTAQLQSVSEKRVEKMKQDQIRQQIAARLVENHDVQIPAFILEKEMQASYQRFQVKESEITTEQKAQIQKIAERNIKLSFILDSVRDVEPDAVLNDQEAQQNLVKYVQEAGQDPNEIFKKGNEEKIRNLLHILKDEFVLQWVCNQSKVITGDAS